MKIGLCDADLLCGGSRFPNLALLKIAGFLKDNDVDFRLIINRDERIDDYDRIYISRVFSFTKMPEFYIKAQNELFNRDKFVIGGTGSYACETDLEKFGKYREEDFAKLDKDEYLCTLKNHRGGDREYGIDMARQMPYYDLYKEFIDKEESRGIKRSKYNDYEHFSIGFLTRGCVRRCTFCVNKLEKGVRKYSEVEWFLDDERDERGNLKRPYIYLWDDNILAAKPEIWRHFFQKLKETGRRFQFRQGLDERMIAQSPYGEEIADILTSAPYYGDYIFAFDHWEDRDIIEKALKIWKSKTDKLTKFYVFCGFNRYHTLEQEWQDIDEIFKRIKLLKKYRCIPYLMRHEDYKKSRFRQFYVMISSWCNQPRFIKNVSLWEYICKTIYYDSGAGLDLDNKDREQLPFDLFWKQYKEGRYEKEGVVLKSYVKGLVDFLEAFPEKHDIIVDYVTCIDDLYYKRGVDYSRRSKKVKKS